ncbi:STAS/SEC14 domain-containing protein [uncultured Roseobacter sp.]|uniref:STAS/SEC14 domain-containing protein n=1 Tax=uncultured Roseobacter sp. TaxID=114847 RepID=UPI00260F8935|nr:STAS/SEC14 domain-containing protein [uncultured Roseobacter sp.]
MFKISKPSENRLDIELSGGLDADEMREALESLTVASQDMAGGKMLYRIYDFEMPTFGALAVEFQQLPKLFGVIGRFGRCAVLCDASWIRTAAEIEGALIPFLEIKSFPLAEAEAAEAWLEDGVGTDEGGDSNVPV